MAPSASIVVPTRNRPAYLEVALASIAPQAAEAGAEVVVVDDAGISPQVRALAERFGARYEPHPRPLGLNAARNTGVSRSSGELVIFVDDDVEVCAGWLAALLDAAREHPGIQVFTGPIRVRLEGRPPRSCGREGPPITSLDLGPDDRDDAPYAWGANMAMRRAALERNGPFDVSLGGAGDEQEWQERLRAREDGRVLYVADAALEHRRAPADARLRALARASWGRGRASRRFDAYRGQAPSLAAELRTLAGCAGHVIRRRCPAGLTMTAHSAGRLVEAAAERLAASAGRAPQRRPGSGGAADGAGFDFLSGHSGTVGGLDGLRRSLADRAHETLQLAGGRRLALDRAARRGPPARRVLALGIVREEHRKLADAVRAQLARSRHQVEIDTCPPGGLGKFQNLNRMLARHSLEQLDWLLVVDDDVVLPRRFLDRFLFLAERFSLDLAQPAHAAGSHAAWEVTRRQAGSVVRETRFVEIGPVTAFAGRTLSTLLPFPDLRMGWGLDLHWAALASERGWRCGVVDAVPIRHRAAPAASGYSRDQAIEEARAFLEDRPYLPATEAERTLLTRRRW